MQEYESIPGTFLLVEFSDQDDLPSMPKIILSPHPTDLPHDPLNWSLIRKYWHSFLLCLITGLTTATSNDVGSAETGMHKDIGLKYSSMNVAAGVLYIGIGYFTFLLSPAALLYGRKISYLFCIVMGLIGAIWMANSQKTTDVVWNQLFVGASETTAEATVQLSLSDIWFKHQRGKVLGTYVLATSIGTFLGPIIADFVAENLGWRWVAWLSVIISSITFVVLFFGLEETLFDRENYTSNSVSEGLYNTTQTIWNFSSSNQAITSRSFHQESSQPVPGTLKAYWERIKPITPSSNLVGIGFKQYMTRLANTLRVLTFPAVIYSGIQWGAQDAWLAFYETIVEDTRSKQSPNYTADREILMKISILTGAISGCCLGGYLSDKLVLYFAKQRKGISEAEDRLWMMLPCGILSPLGLFIFGISISDSWNLRWSCVSSGMVGFGWGCAGDLSMVYLMDVYPDLVLEGMVGVSVINNSIGCVFSFAVSSWIEQSGIRNCTISVGCLSLFFLSLTIPMKIFGKRSRRRTADRYRELVNVCQVRKMSARNPG